MAFRPNLMSVNCVNPTDTMTKAGSPSPQIDFSSETLDRRRDIKGNLLS